MKEERRMLHFVADVEKFHITSKERDAHLVGIPKLISENVLFPSTNLLDNWGKKAIRRRTTGTGRMRYLKDIPRKYFLNLFFSG